MLLQRTTPRPDQPNPTMGQVCHVGYVTFFPLFLRLLPADSPRIPQMLEVLADPTKTWSTYVGTDSCC